ncbi:MAG: hypothetical protein ACJ8AK_03075 [Gemmatimonadaceae bacterium]
MNRFRAQAARITRWIADFISKYPGEFAVSLAILVGWFLLTASVVELLPARRHALWLASTGVLLISLCGWRFIGRIATDGLYALTRKRNG